MTVDSGQSTVVSLQMRAKQEAVTCHCGWHSFHMEREPFHMEREPFHVVFCEKRLTCRKNGNTIKENLIDWRQKMAKSFSDKLSAARLMAAGLKAHAQEVAAVGVKKDVAQKLEAAVKTLSDLDTKQEKLKAELKACTAKMTEAAKQMAALSQDAQKRVKIAVPSSLWKEFGISAKK